MLNPICWLPDIIIETHSMMHNPYIIFFMQSFLTAAKGYRTLNLPHKCPEVYQYDIILLVFFFAGVYAYICAIQTFSSIVMKLWVWHAPYP